MSATEINPNQVINAICHEFTQKIDIATAFVWLHYKLHNEKCTPKQINYYFEQALQPKYNTTRLNENFIRNKSIIAKNRTYIPNPKLILDLDKKFASYLNHTENVECKDLDGSILPKSIYKTVNHSYIKRIGEQINASYDYNIFDGCAILMRRLLETLLVLICTKKGFISSNSNESYTLSSIIEDTKNNNIFSKKLIDSMYRIRDLGNFSAHTNGYYAVKKDIDHLKDRYRVLIQILLSRLEE